MEAENAIGFCNYSIHRSLFSNLSLILIFSILITSPLKAFYPFGKMFQDDTILTQISTDELNERFLQPVINGLKRNVAHDPLMTSLVNNIKPFISPKATRYPNMWAYDIKGKPYIQLDFLYILDIFPVCMLGATTLIYSNVNDKLFERMGMIYLADCAEQFNRHEEFPKFYPDLSMFGVDKKYEDALVYLTNQIMDHFITYIILHEMAHIVLGHTESDTDNDEQAQDEELLADMWAFQKMYEMDYSISLLEAAMVGNSAVEIVRETVGYKPNANTHPSWIKRVESFESFKTMHPLQRRSFIDMHGLSILKYEEQTIPMEIWLALSTRTDGQGRAQGICIVTVPEEYTEIRYGVVEYRDKEGHLYFRNGPQTIHITINNTTDYTTEATCEYNDIGAEGISRFPFRLYQYGIGSIKEIYIDGVDRMGDVLEFDLIAFYQNELEAMKIDLLIIEEIIDLVKYRIEVKNSLLKRHVIGEFSLDEGNEIWFIINDFIDFQIKQLLGENSYNQIIDALVRSPSGRATNRLASNTSLNWAVSRDKFSETTDFIFADRRTRLTWTKFDNLKNLSFSEADAYCDNLIIGEYSDWRLPTITELKTLYRKKSNSRFRIIEPIRLSSCYCWSSTESFNGNYKFHFNTGEEDPGYLPTLPECENRALCVHY